MDSCVMSFYIAHFKLGNIHWRLVQSPEHTWSKLIWNFTLDSIAFPHILSTQLASVVWIFHGLQYFCCFAWFTSNNMSVSLAVSHLILFHMPCPFNRRSCLRFASHPRAEKFPKHHFPRKTLGPSPNLRGAGVDAVGGSARRCCSSAKLC